MSNKPVATMTFTTELVKETSTSVTPLGSHESTMDLYITPGENRGMISWDVPATEDYEEIGVWWNDAKELTDYDGIMGWLPKEAVSLLNSQGITVSDEFTGANE